MTSSNRKLQHARLRYHWSQEELARRLQTTQQSIARWENGKVRPSPFYRQKLCEIFEASEETLGFVDMQEKRLSSVSNDKLQAVIDPLLPLPLGPALVGRDALLATLKVKLFSTQGVPMAIIHGIPGVGKTTVAAALAHDEEVRAYFTGGILWVGLGPKPHILAHLSRWGVLLGVRGDTRSTLEEWSIALRMAIGSRKMLVVIDDAWEIESALACKIGGVGCAFVLTTRFPSIASYFTPTNVTTLHELNNENSLQLLSYLAPGIIQHDPEAVHSLVRTVGGLPIGLILLGSYLNRYAYDRQSRRINTALQHLQDASVLLGLTMVQAPDVQTTFSLGDLIKLSETTLSEEERCAFHALAIFPAKPNSFSEEAALVVTNAQVDVLDKLSDAGLIETPGEARYTLHQTIRMYATTHRNSGWDIEERFTSYYARFVQDHKMNYLALEPESVNISTAFEVASQQEFLFAQYGQSIIRNFSHFLIVCGLYTTAESLLKRALRSDGLDASAYSEILLFLGMIAKKYGHLAEAETYHQQGLVLAQQNEDPLMEVRHLSRLGFLYTLRQHYNQAKSTFLEALEKARLVHDPLEVCTLMNGLVVVFKETASYVDAKQYIHEGLALARQYELNEREAVFLINWSTIESLQGNTSLAEHLAQQALALAEIHGLRENLTYLNNLLSELAMDRKNYEQAITYSSNCLILARQSGNVELIGASLATLGTAYGWLEEFEEARAYFQEAFTIITTSNFPLLLQETQLRCADMYILAGQEKQAQVLFQKLVEAEELDIRAGALFGLARIFTLWGDLQTAKKYAEQCLALSKAIGHEIVPIQQWLEQYRTE